MITRKHTKTTKYNNSNYKHESETDIGDENELSEQQTQNNIYYKQYLTADKQYLLQQSVKAEDDQKGTTINRRKKKNFLNDSRDYNQTQYSSSYHDKQQLEQQPTEYSEDYNEDDINDINDDDISSNNSDSGSLNNSQEMDHTNRQILYLKQKIPSCASMSKAKKMPWSEDEDRLVIQLVEQYGPQKWTFIAQHIPGRIGKQCRERWHNHLNPKINKEAWTDEEEWVLFLCHKLKGNKWAEITSFLPGRTDNAIKNHWNSSMKKRINELLTRFMKLKQNQNQNSASDYLISGQYKESENIILQELFLQDGDMAVDDYFLQNSRHGKRRKSNVKIEDTPQQKYQVKNVIDILEKMPVDFKLVEEMKSIFSSQIFEEECENQSMIQVFKFSELEDLLTTSEDDLSKIYDLIKHYDSSERKMLTLPTKEKKKRGRKPKVMKDLSSVLKPIPDIKQEAQYHQCQTMYQNEYSFYTPQKKIFNNEGRMMKIVNPNLHFDNHHKSGKYDDKLIQKVVKIENENYPQPVPLQNVQNVQNMHQIQQNIEISNNKETTQNNNNNFFSSPSSLKYESPSRLLNLHTPDPSQIDKYLIGAHISSSSKQQNNLFNQSAYRDNCTFRDTSPYVFQKFTRNRENSSSAKKPYSSSVFTDIKQN